MMHFSLNDLFWEEVDENRVWECVCGSVLRYNWLTGGIPAELAKLTALTML